MTDVCCTKNMTDVCLEFENDSIIFSDEKKCCEYKIKPPCISSSVNCNHKFSIILPPAIKTDSQLCGLIKYKISGTQDTQIKLEYTKKITVDDDGSIMANCFITTSDRCKKKNIELIENHTILNKINGYVYYLKDTNEKSAGIIAQEIENILPFAVHNVNGIKSVNYTIFIPYLIEGYKDIQRTITKIHFVILLLVLFNLCTILLLVEINKKI